MPNIKSVLATVRYEAHQLERLRRIFAPAEVLLVARNDHSGIAAALEKVDVAVLGGDLDERHIAAPQMKWVHCDHAGLNRSARPEVFQKGLIVTSSAGRSSPVLAEHAIYFMLALAFNSVGFLEAQRAHHWGVAGQDELRGLFGNTVGIVGLGNTGSDLAARLKAMGMRVLGYRRRAGEPVPGVDRQFSAEAGDTLDALLRESDYVVLAVPLSDSTFHLIGERELGLMKSTARLVNMARGAVVDEDALLRALRDGRIAGAGLDTFAKEPLPAESPLWDAPNTLITPHVTPQVPDRTGRSLDIIEENARRYRAGEPMLNLLRPEDVYTKESPPVPH